MQCCESEREILQTKYNTRHVRFRLCCWPKKQKTTMMLFELFFTYSYTTHMSTIRHTTKVRHTPNKNMHSVVLSNLKPKKKKERNSNKTHRSLSHCTSSIHAVRKLTENKSEKKFLEKLSRLPCERACLCVPCK